MSAMQRKWFMHCSLSLAIIKCVSNHKRKILNVKYNSNKYKMWNTNSYCNYFSQCNPNALSIHVNHKQSWWNIMS